MNTNNFQIDDRGMSPKDDDYDGRIKRSDSHHEIILRNRTFGIVDQSFRFLPTRILDAMVRHSNGEKVVVLDMGGGPASTSLRGIVKHWEQQVNCINVDFVAGYGGSTPGIKLIRGDVLNLPLRDESVNFSYCINVTQNLPSAMYEEGVPGIVSEMARVLKPGGVGILDDDGTLENLGPLPLDLKPNIKTYSLPRGIFLSPVERFERLISERLSRTPGLVIAKEPVPKYLDEIICPSIWNLRRKFDLMRS